MFKELRASRIAKAAGRARLRANDGTERWVHCSAVCLDAGTAAVSRLVVFIEDKSEAVQLERRMREADRIASLGMLGAGLGHELGNVLLPMQAHLNALKVGMQRGAGLDELADNIAAIGGGIAYLRELADGMHYLGRGEPDGQTFAEVTSTHAGTLPSAWWPQAERLLRCAVPTATRLDVRIDDACPRVAMQSNVLMQSLVNLLVNARDAVIERHGPQGRGGVIEITFEPVGCGKDARVGVRVSDNGSGMNESTLARAREPFYTTKPAGRGTGLGLAMVSSAVAQAAGLLSIESAVGVGTHVTMLLPIAAS
jgi:signal transduction histidine kinase